MIDGSENGVMKVDAGIAIRRQVRAQVDMLGLHGEEYKGLLVSTFVVRGSNDQLSKLLTWIRSLE